MNNKKLERWAQQLLDTGKRNNLINFKDTKLNDANYGYNLCDDISSDDLGCWDEEGMLRQNYKFQVSLGTMGNIDEILLFFSVGDLCLEMVTYIYRIEKHTINKIAKINGFCFMDLDYSLSVPFGGQGLFETYLFVDGTIVHAEELF